MTHKILAAFAGATLLVLLGAAAVFWSFGQIDDAAEARHHTRTLVIGATELLSELKDAETGQRGYVLTGDEGFLQPYLAVRKGLSTRLLELRQAANIAAARKHLDTLSPLLDAKLAELARVIELRRGDDAAGALSLIRAGKGKHLMDLIRTEIDGFIRIEEEALERHEAEFQTNMRRMFILIVGASLLMLLFAVAFAYFIYRETQQRLQNLVHLETKHLLESQQSLNSKLQEANDTLQVSEEKLAVTLYSIGDAVMVTDDKGRVTLLNPLAEQLTGWTQAKAVGRAVDEVFHIINQETRLPAYIPVMDTLAKGTIQGLANHTVLIALDGSESAIADSCAPIRDNNGRVVGAVLVFRDVTGEYATQQSLRDNAELIQTILNTVADGIVTLRARDGIVKTINPAAERMFGYSAADLIGHDFSLLIPESDSDERKAAFKNVSSGDKAWIIGLGRETTGRHRNGSTFPMDIAISQMWMGGERYLTCILRDISARKQAEAALVKAGALQAAIFNSANFSSIATDARGVIQIFNV
ncbi:MAG TPA: hypothetical protein DCK83_07530, partial [Gallionellaceae bacterium]|nr:hypothetical protein [Gallionellaceae bacterium]